MNGKDAIKTALRSTGHLVNWFLSDLSDADLLVRPVPGANHLAWQLGHLIAVEHRTIEKNLPGAALPELPAGFRDRYTRETAASDDTGAFLKKAEYQALFNNQREASITAVEQLAEADLDRPTTGPVAKLAPTVGALLLLTSYHTTLHLGQVSVVRRKLGKPVLF
jgi:hypothetical protein